MIVKKKCYCDDLGIKQKAYSRVGQIKTLNKKGRKHTIRGQEQRDLQKMKSIQICREQSLLLPKF
jgi:hypothetical protein